MNNKRIIKDGHIHSPYCPHGTDDPFELYIEMALKLGLKEITFMEHMPLPKGFGEPEVIKYCSPSIDKIEAYIEELEYLKAKYMTEIKINTGLEVDYIEGYEEKSKELLDRYGTKLDESILSVHFIKLGYEYYRIDLSTKEFGKLV